MRAVTTGEACAFRNSMPANKPRVAFKTLGCRLNQAETATIAAQFEAAGYEIVPFGTQCEVALIHGCTVTRNAETESIRLAGSAKKGKGSPFVVLAGCAAMNKGSADTISSKSVDMLAPQDTKFSLPQLLHSRFSTGGNTPITPARIIPRFTTARARVKVQDGCDINCAYCIVPATRGSSVSRPFGEIIAEIAALGDAGFKEVILTGANLGCYKDGSRRLVHLLEAVHEVEAIARIRLSSIEPGNDEHAVIDFMAQAPKVCRHLHIPLQTGHDGLLTQMGRPYTAAEFRAVVDYAVAKLGPIGLGTDLIAGLPGEDNDAFEATYRMVTELPFSNLHVFPYSQRPDTKASLMSGQVPEAIKKERVQRLITLGSAKKKSFIESCAGRTVTILVEQAAGPDRGTGWTGEYVRACVKSPAAARNQVIAGIATRVEKGLLQVQNSCHFSRD